MKVPTLEKLFEDQLKDIYSAENQLIKALPKMAKAASTPALQEAINGHLEETKGQVQRLDKIGKQLDMTLTGKKCVAMEGLIEEGGEALEMEAPEAIIDLAIIAAAQKVEHYEMSAYGTARAMAEQLGEDEVVALLQETLDEESAADEKLTGIATDDVFPNVSNEAEDENIDEDDGEEAKNKGTGKKATAKATR